MKQYLKYGLLFSIGLLAACNNNQNQKNMSESNSLAFSKGEEVNNNNFTGKVWLNMLVNADSILNTQIGNVTFEPGARTNWHYHKGGQILLVTEGKGLYQEKGKPVESIKKGDVMKCPPDVEHWHGASPTEAMTHIAISPNINIGSVVWLQPVTDKEYNSK
jgi:quercetin dioxygenase-like cupin family protein